MATEKNIKAELAKAVKNSEDKATIRRLRRELKQEKELKLKILFDPNSFNKRRGRKPLFRDHMFKEGKKLASLGLTVERIADFWQINPVTLWRWTKKNPRFCKTIREAKEAADAKVVESLFNRACGYQYEEKTFERTLLQIRPIPAGVKATDEDFYEKEILKKRVVRELAPDGKACEFWLLNRQPDAWKAVTHQVLTGKDDKPIDIRFVRMVDPEKKEAQKKADSGNGNGRGDKKKIKKIKK